MTRARWILSAATLFTLWLFGALYCLPRLQRDLEAAARDTLSRQPALRDRLGALHISFDGQQALLTGSVRTRQDRSAIETAVRDLVRAPAPLSAGLARHLNPVSSVQSSIAVVPFPPGWLLLAATGSHARLLGTAASEYEARDLSRSVQESWSAQGGMIEGTPRTDAEAHDEAPQVTATLRALPAPQSAPRAYLARIGRPWQELALDHTDSELLAEAHTQGVTDAEWQHQVRPVLDELRTALQQQQRTEAENARLARLPPGYLFIAARDHQVILRGEVGTAAMKRSILADALIIFSPSRLHDEIRVSALRRPGGDFGLITTALLPESSRPGGKSCFLSLSGAAWKPVDWQITPREQSWHQDLPAGLDPKPLQQDSTRLSTWLEDSAPQSPAPSTHPAFITLALFDSRAMLSGQVAEPAVQEQLVAAVRQAYAPRFLVSADALHLRGSCAPSGGILQTLKSLPPPPAATSPGLLAIARPGGTWTLIPVTHDLLEAGGLARSKRLPPGLPAAVVDDITAESLELLRMHLAHLVSP